MRRIDSEMNCDVSVVIPTYNSSGTLERALDSVYRQVMVPREIIVVDDGSDDWEQSERIAASGPDSIATRFIHMDQNQGVSAARNVGISAARCRYLAFLDSDDIWYKDKLSIQYRLMTGHNLDFSMHRYCHDITRSGGDNYDHDSDDLASLPLSPLSSWTPLLRNDSTNSVMVSMRKMIFYETSLRRGEDFALYMELLSRRGCRAVYIKRVLAGGFKNTIGVSGLSQDVKGMHSGRMLALKKLLDGGKISTVQYLFGIWTEMAKYPVRIFRIWLAPLLRRSYRRSLPRQESRSK
jgi:glycosyltransferase involved in cell wall biosynthesis